MNSTRRKSKIDIIIKKYGHLWFMLLFPVVLFYYECIFKLITKSDNFFTLSLLYTLFFSAAYGGVAYLLCSIFKKRSINRTITTILLIISAIHFLIEYFVFRQFKAFYDVRTVIGGTGNVLGGFMGDAFKMIFSFKGLFVILLFFLPTILYLLLGSRFLPAFRSNLPMRLFSGTCSVMFYFITIMLISFNSMYQPLLNKEYEFQSAVGKFGLYTATTLDIKNIFLGTNNISFEDTNLDELIPVDTERIEEFKEYGYNTLNIDFDALQKSTKNQNHIKLDKYVSSLTATKQNKYTGLFKGKNLIMITAEAFSKEVIDPNLTPTLYRLATKGINFTDYYGPFGAGTTGGEYNNVFGMFATGSSFKKSANNNNYYTMGNQLNRLGYFGMAFHNNTHTVYDRNKTHINIGYSNGFMAQGSGIEEFVTKQWPQSDLEMLEGTLLKYVDGNQPFNFYYMSVSGHSGYTKSGNAMTRKNWDKVQHLNYSDSVKGYLAANMELENALTRTLEILQSKGILNDTVICISPDHMPYGLDDDAPLGKMPYLSELYGYDVTTSFQRDHNQLIIWSGCLEDKEPIIVDTPTYSLDILPTLSNLFGTEFDSRLMVGRDVFSDAEPLVVIGNDWKTQYGTYYASNGKFVENSDNPLPDGTDQKEYIRAIKTLISGKKNFCNLVLESNYFEHVFG